MTLPRTLRTHSLLLSGGILLAACGGESEPPSDTTDQADAASLEAPSTEPADAFLASLAGLCGRAFAGTATFGDTEGFEDLVMHVRECRDGEVLIPLHAGENRSRTWIVTRTDGGLRLKHDHRLEDGSDDPVTWYGGDTATPGTALSQSFPADAETAALIPAAATNEWTMTLEPGERFIYHLTRDGAPRATFEFDLTGEVDPPPAPWGYETTGSSGR